MSPPPHNLQVALKRIPDVLSNAENTKRVLREVCILRRLEHKNIIALKDVFLRPASTGMLYLIIQSWHKTAGVLLMCQAHLHGATMQRGMHPSDKE
jgi:hypothetical protein